MYHPAQGFQLGGILQQHLVGNRGIVIIIGQMRFDCSTTLYFKILWDITLTITISQTISGCWTHPLNFVKFRNIFGWFQTPPPMLGKFQFSFSQNSGIVKHTKMDIKCEVYVVKLSLAIYISIWNHTFFGIRNAESSTVSVSVSYQGRPTVGLELIRQLKRSASPFCSWPKKCVCVRNCLFSIFPSFFAPSLNCLQPLPFLGWHGPWS